MQNQQPQTLKETQPLPKCIKLSDKNYLSIIKIELWSKVKLNHWQLEINGDSVISSVSEIIMLYTAGVLRSISIDYQYIGIKVQKNKINIHLLQMLNAAAWLQRHWQTPPLCHWLVIFSYFFAIIHLLIYLFCRNINF